MKNTFNDYSLFKLDGSDEFEVDPIAQEKVEEFNKAIVENNGILDAITAQKFAAWFARISDMYTPILNKASYVVAHAENEVDRKLAEGMFKDMPLAMASKVKDSATAREKYAIAFDKDYHEAQSFYLKAKKVKEEIELRVKTFDKYHYMCKIILESENKFRGMSTFQGIPPTEIKPLQELDDNLEKSLYNTDEVNFK